MSDVGHTHDLASSVKTPEEESNELFQPLLNFLSTMMIDSKGQLQFGLSVKILNTFHGKMTF